MNNNPDNNSSKITIEDSFKEIDAIIKKLEEPSTGLEKSIDLYEKAMELLSNSKKELDEYESKIIIIREKHGDFLKESIDRDKK